MAGLVSAMTPLMGMPVKTWMPATSAGMTTLYKAIKLQLAFGRVSHNATGQATVSAMPVLIRKMMVLHPTSILSVMNPIPIATSSATAASSV
jgi:hypothetical protein